MVRSGLGESNTDVCSCNPAGRHKVYVANKPPRRMKEFFVPDWEGFEKKLREFELFRANLEDETTLYVSPLLYRGQQKSLWSLRNMGRHLAGTTLIKTFCGRFAFLSLNEERRYNI